MAANLGDDADTTAAVCGQIAGAYYGQAGISVPWVDKLYMRDEIISLVVKLAG
jgi:ADP-ribosyl-[dinitrogen reductase] hydrolase